MSITYLSREDWGAGPQGSGYPIPNSQIVGLVAHHTVMVLPDYDGDGYARGDIQDIKRYMKVLQHARPDLGDEVPYSFVVFPGKNAGDGVVAEGRGKGRTGAHTSGYNSTRFGVAYAGNASTEPVTPGVIAAYNWVGANMLDNPARAVKTIGHRDTKSTECPGNNLYARLSDIQPPFTTNQGDWLMDAKAEIMGVVKNQRKLLASQMRAMEERINLKLAKDDKQRKVIIQRLNRIRDEIVALDEPEALAEFDASLEE